MSYHHGDLKKALLDAAHTLLGEVGVEKLSLRKVAQKAGVSHAAPYHHFNDKTMLLQMLAARAYTLLDESMRKEQEQVDDDPRRELLATGLGYIRFAMREPDLFALMWNRDLVPMNHPELMEPADASFSRLVDAVVRVFHHEKKTERDPMLLALYLWSNVHGLSHLGRDNIGDSVKPDAVYLMMCENMMNAAIDAA